VLIDGETIAAVGTEAEVLGDLPREAHAGVEEIDAAGRVVVPGIVDPHTHLVFAGHRATEFEARLLGAEYLATLQAGGGILQTVRATRAADDDRLAALIEARLRRYLVLGVTTIEVKSGYGLTVAEELRHLKLIRRAAAAVPMQVDATLLALHARPPEYQDDPAPWIDQVCDELIPAVAEAGLATGCDVFVQPGVFSIEECRRVLYRGRQFGLAGHVHADQLGWTGGAELAAEQGALSADHLGHISDAGIQAMVATGTVAVLIPGSMLFVPGEMPAPARKMIDAGVTIALSTDFSPGSSPISSPSLVLGLGAAMFGISAAEALAAATINAACVLGRADQVGSLEVGKRADLLLVEADDYRELPYRFGERLIRTVIAGGRIVAEGPAVGSL
jgi:imidazolonepropionase